MLHRLADLRIATRMFLGFSVVCLLLVTVAGVAVVRLQQAQADLHQLAGSGLRSVETSEQTDNDFLQLRFDLASAALARDPAATETALQSVEADTTALDEQWAAYLRTSPASTPAQRSAFTDALAAYRAVLPQLEERARSGDTTGFLDLRSRTATPAAARASKALDAITAAETDAAAAMVARARPATARRWRCWRAARPWGWPCPQPWRWRSRAR